MSELNLKKYRQVLSNFDPFEYGGIVTKIVGLTVEANGPAAQIGDVCNIFNVKSDNYVKSEVVGFRENRVILMPFGNLTGIGPGSRVVSTNRPLRVPVGKNFIGKVLDAMGNPFDGSPPPEPDAYYPVDNDPPNPMSRDRIHDVLPLGIKAIDGMLTMGRGQRLGIFAGSGVGKSTLLGMIARNATADINIIALVGERGREVKDFIERDLGPEGLKKSILVIATSDQSALMRLKCAMVGTSMAEYFRDQGYKVLLMMDSLTRFAMAQREIGMSTGEPPVSRGYPPSVYTVLPRLLERSGNSDKGSITALYTVLVEGDDMNEPIADTVRGILDGHIILSRKIANGNHYPPIDILGSVSRVMPDIITPEHIQRVGFIKNKMAVYQEAQDLINIGAYQKGANPEIDEAVKLHAGIQAFLKQGVSEDYTFDQVVQMLADLAGK